MRNRGMIEAMDLIPLFFELLHAKDKLLRKLLKNHIISDIKRMNAKHKNVKLNNVSILKNLFMFSFLILIDFKQKKDVQLLLLSTV